MPEARARPWVTYALIAANVVMFGVELAHGASPIAPRPQQIIELGGSYPPLTLNGEWWRLGASMFLHFGALHIALNMVCLYQARVVEQLFGRAGFLAIYLLAGIGGGIATLLVSSSNGVSAGASGAVFGVYGAFGAFLVLRRSEIEAEAWQRTARSLGRFLVLNLIVGLTVTSISVSAHAGGLLVGFAVGAALLAGARAAHRRWLRAVGLVAVGLAVAAVAVRSLDAAPDVTPVLQHFEVVESAALTRWNDLLNATKAQTITPGEAAEIVEREVIAPYKKMREATLATRDVPERLRPLFARLDELTLARITAWERWRAATHEADPGRRAAKLEAYRASELDVGKRLEAYNAEVRSLPD